MRTLVHAVLTWSATQVWTTQPGINGSPLRPRGLLQLDALQAQLHRRTECKRLHARTWNRPAAGTFGNATRNGFFGPRMFNADASLNKTFLVYRTSDGPIQGGVI